MCLTHDFPTIYKYGDGDKKNMDTLTNISFENMYMIKKSERIRPHTLAQYLIQGLCTQ